jgi:hypothetical protein
MTTAAKRIELEIRQLPLEDMLVLHEHLVASSRNDEYGNYNLWQR